MNGVDAGSNDAQRIEKHLGGCPEIALAARRRDAPFVNPIKVHFVPKRMTGVSCSPKVEQPFAGFATRKSQPRRLDRRGNAMIPTQREWREIEQQLSRQCGQCFVRRAETIYPEHVQAVVLRAIFEPMARNPFGMAVRA